MATVTASNANLTLTVLGLFLAPQRIYGFAADAAFAANAVTPAEVMMGVDGRMSAGYTPYTTEFPITLQADSPSIPFFDAWLAAQKALGEIYFANGAITLPAVNRSFILTRGVLTSATALPTVNRVLQPRPFTITWESIDAVPV